MSVVTSKRTHGQVAVFTKHLHLTKEDSSSTTRSHVRVTSENLFISPVSFHSVNGKTKRRGGSESGTVVQSWPHSEKCVPSVRSACFPQMRRRPPTVKRQADEVMGNSVFPVGGNMTKNGCLSLCVSPFISVKTLC